MADDGPAHHHAHDDEPNEDARQFPINGVVQPGSTRRKLVLDRVSEFFHHGMSVRLTGPDGASSVHPVLRFTPMRPELVLEQALPFDPAGMWYVTLPRDHPADIHEWNEYEVVCAIRRTYNDFTEHHDKQWQYDALSSDDLELTPDSSIQEIEQAFRSHRSSMDQIKQRGEELGVLGHRDEFQLMIWNELQHINMVYCTLYEVLRAEKELSRVMIGASAEATNTYTNPWWYNTEAGDEEGDLPELFEFFLQRAYRDGLKKRGDIVYEQVTVEGDYWHPLPDNPVCRGEECERLAQFGEAGGAREFCPFHVPDSAAFRDLRYGADGKMHPNECQKVLFGTRAWRPKMLFATRQMTICDWIHTVLDRNTHRDLWVKLVSNYSRNFSACENFLKRTHDASFPVYVPDQSYFAYQNGIYHIDKNRFYEFGQGNLPSVCCINYVDQHFRPEWTTLPLNDPRMQVDGYKDVQDSQMFDAPMRDWLDTFLGRLFYPVNERDKWEKLLVIKGWAATGKSTIAKAVAKLIGDVNVGLIPSNCEEDWALANVHDKAIWMCLELKSNFRLPTGLLQNMASGEPVLITEKYKTAFDVLWRIQGLLVGNELPLSWTQDVMNALVRRVVPFPFDVSPSTQDVTLAPRFLRNLGKFHARINRVYLEMTQRVGARQIDDLLPERLKEATSEFKKRTSPLLRFLEDSDDIELAKEEERRFMLHYLHRHQGLSAEQLGLSAAAVEAASRDTAEEERIMRVSDPLAMLHEWHVPMSEIQARFKAWAELAGLKRSNNIINAEIYRPAARAKKLAVVRDLKIRGKKLTKEVWVGLRLKNATRNTDPETGNAAYLQSAGISE